MRIFVNGSPVEVEEDATITVTNEPETEEVAEVKESRLSKAKTWVSNHKLLTAGGAVAGYCALKKLFASTSETEEDNEEETETETEEETEEE